MVINSNLELTTSPKYPEYERRKPEESVLYEVIRKNLLTFLDQTQSSEKGLPTYVKNEFENLLECGVLACGFSE